MRALAAVALLAASACMKPPALWFERGKPHSTLSFSARDASAVRIVGGVASVELNAGVADSVHIYVELRSTDVRRLNETCIPTARVEQTISDGQLVLRLLQPERNRCGETWRVSMPARYGATLEFAHLTARVIGIRGGLSARASNGSISATLDGGAANLELDVGDIELTSRQNAYEQVHLKTNVGRAELTINRYRVHENRRPGAGDEVRVVGEGTGRIWLRTGVGSIRAKIGE